MTIKKFEINVHQNKLHDRFLIKRNKKNLIKILKVATKEVDSNKFEVSLSLVSSKKIRQINNEYRQKDVATDVLSFPQLEKFNKVMDLGDVFINSQILKKQAKSIESDENTELCFLFMHGLLHLIGYDHIDKKDEIIMINKQKEIFRKVGIRND